MNVKIADMKHDKNLIQIKFALMLRQFIEIPRWKFRKYYKKWKEINEFAKQHKDCCEIEW